jgi:type IV pilus assembly protein PilX
LTIIGVSGIRSTAMEEKMAGNMRDKALAFQAAEAALRRGQQFFIPLVGTGAFDGTGGQYGSGDNSPDYWADATWSSSNSFGYTDSITNVASVTPIPGVATQPRFIAHYIGDISQSSKSLNMGGYGKQVIGDVSDFRITARGTGGTDDSVVILQAYYGKRL